MPRSYFTLQIDSAMANVTSIPIPIQDNFTVPHHIVPAFQLQTRISIGVAFVIGKSMDLFSASCTYERRSGSVVFLFFVFQVFYQMNVTQKPQKIRQNPQNFKDFQLCQPSEPTALGRWQFDVHWPRLFCSRQVERSHISL